MGSEVNFLAGSEPLLGAQGPNLNSSLHLARDSEFLGEIRRFPGPSNRTEVWDGPSKNDAALRFLPSSYSAAVCRSFGSAADSMKSLIRGTISDLKREPLNTP